MKTKFYIIFCIITTYVVDAQTILSANGEGQTYEEINAVLAPDHNVVEVPDCAHQDFGRHIKEIFDDELSTYVFEFIAHVTPDNDRCKNFDRQRVEIKTYGPSPDSLKATQGETVVYQWKFKLPRNFKVSKSFTHLHQIKSVDGPYASMPMVTLTARKGSDYDKLEVRATATNNQRTLTTADLDLFRGQWLTVKETIYFNDEGSYEIEIRSIEKDKKLLKYKDKSIDMWQDGATFARPKWGIYRSLKQAEDLKDEQVLFNDFRIEEVSQPKTLDLDSLAPNQPKLINSSTQTIDFDFIHKKDYDAIKLYDTQDEELPTKKRISKQSLDISGLNDGLYYLVFFKDEMPVKVRKYLIVN